MTKQNAISGVVGSIVATDDVAEVVENTAETNGTEKDKLVGKLFSTYEEAAENRPPSAKAEAWRVFEVTRPNGGETVYLWGFTGINAVNHVARADGYNAVAANSKRGGPRTVNVGAVVTNAFNMSEEDLRKHKVPDAMIAAILATRQGSTNAEAHVAAADSKRDNPGESESKPASKGGGRNRKS